MKVIACIAVLAGSAGAAAAQSPPDLTTDQAAIIYDQCLARAAAGAMRAGTSPEDIYQLARAACTQTRTLLVAGQDPDSERVRVLSEIDAERAATFPERTRRFREMLREYQPQAGVVSDAKD